MTLQAGSQAGFVGALLDAARPAPAGLTDPQGRPAGRRFDVYRNNVAVSLTEALETGFPVIRKLVGERFFQAMAGVFLRAHPPESPVLMVYGSALPGFLADFAPAAKLPYLPDVARLELALRHAYHAADAAAIDPARLQTLPPEALSMARPTLAPAAQVLTSRYPLHAIWHANTDPNAPRPSGGAQGVLISRPGYDPVADPLTPPEASFVAALASGASFADAAQAGASDAVDFDPTAVIGLLIARGTIIDIAT